MNENNDITTNGMDWENSPLSEDAQRAAGMVSEMAQTDAIPGPAVYNTGINSLPAISREVKLNLVIDETASDPAFIWAKVLGGYTEYINKELQAIIDNAKEVLTYLESTPKEALDLAKLQEFGLTEEQAANLKNNAEELAAAYQTIQDRLNQFDGNNPFTTFIQHAQALENITAELKQANAEVLKANTEESNQAKEKLTYLKQQEKVLKEGLKKPAQDVHVYLADVGKAFQDIGKAVGDIGLESFGKALSDIGNIGKTFIEKGPIAAGFTALTTRFGGYILFVR